MHQRDFILRMIEQFGQLLIALRKMIVGGGGDREEVESALQKGSQEMGFDLDLIRGFSLDSLLMLVGKDGEIHVDRAWLMAEIFLLDGMQAARVGEAATALESLTKARALYELVGPDGAMLVGIPEISERVAEIDRVMRDL